MARPPIPLAELDEVLEPWAPVWQQLQGKSLFITGGTGNLGTWLLELFCRANRRWRLGAQVRVLSRNPGAFQSKCPHLAQDPAVAMLEGDIRTFAPLAGPVDYVIHGATDASGPFGYSDLLGHLETIVQGTHHLLGRAREVQAGRVLYLSSGAVYGTQPPDLDLLPETWPGAPDPLDPGTRYAQGKRMGEHLCMVFQQQFGLEAVIARGFAQVGPHLPLNAHFAIGNFIRDALKGGPVEVLGDGSPFRSYLYAADYAMACWLILLAGAPGRAYNVGSPEPIQLGALARLVAGLGGQEVVIRQTPATGGLPSRYVPSDLRIRRELGFQPRVDLISSIRRTMDWYRM